MMFGPLKYSCTKIKENDNMAQQVFKNPNSQADSMIPDELEMFVDDLYENKINEYNSELDLDDDRHAYFEKAPYGSGHDFQVTITKGDDILDEWGDWYPIKRARQQAKAELIKRLRGIK